MLRVNQTSPLDWIYLAEGGANIVFRYRGSNLLFVHHVLRLPKTSRAALITRRDEQLDLEAFSSRFRDQVILKLLGSEFLPSQRPVGLDPGFLSELNEQSLKVRPASRILEGGLDIHSTEALLMEDLTRDGDNGENVLVVEIKPKWGFLPSPESLPEDRREIMTVYGRTCMHRQLKCQSSALNDVESAYCPLDLFSKHEYRVRRAVGELWKGWKSTGGKGNQMRIFARGKTILPDDTRDLDQLLPSSFQSTLPERFEACMLPFLKSTLIFDRLASLQRDLDPLSIPTLLDLPTLKARPSSSIEPMTLPELAHFVQRYKTGSRSTDWSDREHLVAFVLSMTFKDCSLIFRLPVDGSPNEGQVKVIDLDLKPLEKLEKWAKLDREIIDHFRNVLARGVEVRRCIDGELG